MAPLTSEPRRSSPVGPSPPLRLHGWTDRAVVGVALAALASGFGQFGLVAALGDVARHFGQMAHGATIADQVGLSGTELGVGLAIIRLASLGSLPLIGAWPTGSGAGPCCSAPCRWGWR